MEIRRYRNTDYSSLIKNLKEADMFNSRVDSKQVLAKKISSNPDSILVALDGKLLVGSVYIIEDPFLCFIFRLVVKKSQRKKGIGKILLEKAEEMLRKKGFTNVHLLVREEELERLRPFYEKHGYKVAKRKHQLFYKKLI